MEQVFIAPEHGLDDKTASDALYLLRHCETKLFKEYEKQCSLTIEEAQENESEMMTFEPHFEFVSILSDLALIYHKLSGLRTLMTESLGENEETDEKYNIAEENVRLSELLLAMESFKAQGIHIYLNLVSLILKLNEDGFTDLLCQQAVKVKAELERRRADDKDV